jgi:hypothetical protein
LISRQWLATLPVIPVRLILAFVIAALVSLAVFSALPTGRMAMRSFKEMLLLLVKRNRESVA